MRQISRSTARQFAATALPAPVCASAGQPNRVGTLLLGCLLLALAGGLAACDDDGEDAAAALPDAGDAGALPQCKEEVDCARLPKPAMQECTNGGTAIFTCARNAELRCAWVHGRCTNPGFDAAPGTGDGGAAPTDAIDAATTEPDAPADLAVD